MKSKLGFLVALQTCEVKPPGGRRGCGGRLRLRSKVKKLAVVQNTRWNLSRRRCLVTWKKYLVSRLGCPPNWGKQLMQLQTVQRPRPGPACCQWLGVGGIQWLNVACHMFRGYVPSLLFDNCYSRSYDETEIKDSSKTSKKSRTRFHSFKILFFILSIKSKKYLPFFIPVFGTALRKMPLFARAFLLSIHWHWKFGIN